MVILSQSGMNSFDMLGQEIVEMKDVDENGNEKIYYRLIGDTIGKSYIIGEYLLIEQAKLIFDDILSSLKKGEKFYDVIDREKKVLK